MQNWFVGFITMAEDTKEEIKKKISALRILGWTDDDICKCFKLTKVELWNLCGMNLWADDQLNVHVIMGTIPT